MKIFISFFILSFFSITMLYSQGVDRKYREVYNYLKSVKQGIEQNINVSPVVRYISISSFSNRLDSLGNEKISAEVKDRNMFYKKNYFDPFLNKSIDTVFSNSKTYSSYVVFSKPVENILLVEVRKGEYNINNLKTPYFGSAMKYLFIFNENDKIARVLNDTVQYN